MSSLQKFVLPFRVPDPRYNDIVDLKPARDHRSQTGDQSVLPPTNTFPKVGHRDRKSRSASFSKRSNVSQARTASFARSVSPTISKLQTGSAKGKLQDCLQTLTHKQKGGTARNKSLLQSMQMDVVKPVSVPVPPDVDMSPRKQVRNTVDDDIVDLVEKMKKDEEEEEEEATMKSEINDAVNKWCSPLPAEGDDTSRQLPIGRNMFASHEQ